MQCLLSTLAAGRRCHLALVCERRAGWTARQQQPACTPHSRHCLASPPRDNCMQPEVSCTCMVCMLSAIEWKGMTALLACCRSRCLRRRKACGTASSPITTCAVGSLLPMGHPTGQCHHFLPGSEFNLQKRLCRAAHEVQCQWG